MEGEENDSPVNEVDLHASIKGHVAGSCDICLDNVHAAMRRCETCSSSLCRRHLVVHGKNAQTAGHELAHLRQQTPRAVGPVTAPSPVAPAHAGVPWTWLFMMVLVALLAVLIPYYGDAPPEQTSPPVILPESASASAELKACCQKVHMSAEEQKRNMAEHMCLLQKDVRHKKRALEEHLEHTRRRVEEGLRDKKMAPYRDVIRAIMQSSDSVLVSVLEQLGGREEGNDVDWCKELPSALQLPTSSSVAS